MKFTIFGDIHGNWTRVNRIVSHENNPTNLSTGDLCNYHFEPSNGQRLIFVSGNHDASNYIEELAQKQDHPLKPISPGETVEIEGTVIAGLPGVFSPFFFDKQEKPARYFSRYDIERVGQLSGIDILLCHISPHRTDIAEVIKKMQPKYVFFGHDHEHTQLSIGNTKVIGLTQPKHSYATLDISNNRVEITKSELINNRYTYQWEND